MFLYDASKQELFVIIICDCDNNNWFYCDECFFCGWYDLMIVNWNDWHDALNDPRWVWGHFTPYEMRCRGSGALMLNAHFMDKLQAIRVDYGKPINVISGYRSPKHNASVSKSNSMTGAHTHGRAADISIEARERDVPLVLELARKHGMTRVGLQLSKARFRLHIDDMTINDRFAARDDGHLFCWTY